MGYGTCLYKLLCTDKTFGARNFLDQATGVFNFNPKVVGSGDDAGYLSVILLWTIGQGPAIFAVGASGCCFFLFFPAYCFYFLNLFILFFMGYVSI